MSVKYTIHALPLATLVLKGNHAFRGHDEAAKCPYTLYCWLLKGDDGSTILVDTGPKDVEELNKGLEPLCHVPVRQTPDQTLQAHFDRLNVFPDDVDLIILTHLHYDHCTNLDLFPDAEIAVNRKGFEEAVRRGGGCCPGEVFFPLRDDEYWHSRLRLLEDEEVVRDGISVFHCGGHTPCSQAVVVDTKEGKAVITGDPVSLYRNLEEDVPIGVAEEFDAVERAMKRVRAEADIVIPSHDPDVMKRHPGGVIG
jgi:glyoxylase-like metal-dependent hydrolase (beta-lactamase superfamily II)